MKNKFRIGFQLVIIALIVFVFFLQNVNANDTDGKWEGPFCMPVQGTHMIHLHTGKILIFPGHFDTSNQIEAWLWNFSNTSENCFGNQERGVDNIHAPHDPDYDPNPNPDCFTFIKNEDTNLFCAGHAAFGDGSVLITGGHRGGTSNNVGLVDANIFDPENETWTGPSDGVASMAERRWYPTVTTLPDDTLLATSGSNRKCDIKNRTGDACTVDGDCGIGGFCNGNSVCAGLDCADQFNHTDCGNNGVCTNDVCDGGVFNGDACTEDIECFEGTCNIVHINDIPEIFDSGLHSGLPNSSWTALANTASLAIPFYPLMFVLPDGKVFYAGSEYDQGNPEVPSTDNRTLDLSNDTWTPVDNSGGVAGGSAVMYEPGKILKAGGMVPSGACNDDSDCAGDNVCRQTGFCSNFNAPTANAKTIDMTGGATWQNAGSMTRGRIRMNLTLLADGSALATGGNRAGNNSESNLRCVGGGDRDEEECTLDPFAIPGSQCEIAPDPGKRSEDCINPDDPQDIGECCPDGDCNAGVEEQYWVAEADLWTPGSGWSQMASMQTPRMYHSTSILLPDGRVLMAGGGQGAGAIHNFHTYEIFSPPYLFDGNNLATQPTVSGVPKAVDYGQIFPVNTPDSADIVKVGLVRLAAATHGFDQNQRYVPLMFADTTNSLDIDAPANANIAPPGYYMLFLVNNDGVPTVGEYIRVSEAPVAKCKDVTVSTDPGVCVATGVSVDDGSFDPGGDPITLSQSPDNPYPLGETIVTLTVTDTNNVFSDTCEAKVTVVDNEPPVLSCNAPATIIPPDVPISFTAMVTDNCGVTETPEVLEVDPFKLTKNGKVIDKTPSSDITFGGDTVTVLDTGGVGTHITWVLDEITDDNGNTADSLPCEVLVVKP